MTKKDKRVEATPPEKDASEAGKKRTLVRHSVESLAGIIKEAAIVYREMRDNKLDHNQGRSLVWVLSQVRAMVETQALERLEARLEELSPSIEGRNGYTRANRPTSATH